MSTASEAVQKQMEETSASGSGKQWCFKENPLHSLRTPGEVIRRHYYARPKVLKNGFWCEDSNAPKVSVLGRKVYIDHVQIPEVCLKAGSCATAVSFQQQSKEHGYLSGDLHFFDHFRHMTGTLSIGPTAKETRTCLIKGEDELGKVTYATQISVDPENDNGGWRIGPDFAYYVPPLSSKCKDPTGKEIDCPVEYWLGEVKYNDEFGANPIFFDGHSFQFTNWDGTPYTNGKISMNWDASTFEGFVYLATDSEAPKKHLWKGSVRRSEETKLSMAPHILGDYKSANGATHVTVHPSGSASVTVAGKAVPNAQSRGNVVHWDNTGDDASPIGASVPPVPLKGVLTFDEAGQDFRGFMSHPLGNTTVEGVNLAPVLMEMSDQDLTVYELANMTSLSTVTDSSGHTITYDAAMDSATALFQNAVQQFMSDEHAKDFFGGRAPLKDDLMKPILYPTDKTTASQVKTFYEDYGIAYLCNGLVTYPPRGEEKYTSEIDIQKVNDYLKKVVPTKEQYKDQTASLYLVAYQEARPRLKLYLDDATPDSQGRTGGAKWASVFLDEMTSNQALMQFRMAIRHHEMPNYRTRVNQWTIILNILDPSGKSASSLSERFWGAMMQELNQVTDFSGPEGKKHLAEVLKDMIDRFLDDMRKNPPKTEAAIDQVKALEQLRESVASTIDLANAFAELAACAFKEGPFQKMITAMMARLANFGNRIGHRIGDALDNLLENYPRLRRALTRLAETGASVLKLLCGSMVYAGMITTLVWGYFDWKEESPLQKAALVVDSVEIFGKTLEYLPNFLRSAGGVFDVALAGWDAYEGMSARIGAAFNNFAKSVEEAGGRVARNLLNRWNRFFNAEGAIDAEAVGEAPLAALTTSKLLAGFLEAVGVVAAIFATAVSIESLCDDISSGASTAAVAIDATIVVMNGLSAIFLATAIFCSWAGPFAILFAIAGIILSIVRALIPPPDPIKKFVEGSAADLGFLK